MKWRGDLKCAQKRVVRNPRLELTTLEERVVPDAAFTVLPQVPSQPAAVIKDQAGTGLSLPADGQPFDGSTSAMPVEATLPDVVNPQPQTAGVEAYLWLFGGFQFDSTQPAQITLPESCADAALPASVTGGGVPWLVASEVGPCMEGTAPEPVTSPASAGGLNEGAPGGSGARTPDASLQTVPSLPLRRRDANGDDTPLVSLSGPSGAEAEASADQFFVSTSSSGCGSSSSSSKGKPNANTVLEDLAKDAGRGGHRYWLVLFSSAEAKEPENPVQAKEGHVWLAVIDAKDKKMTVLGFYPKDDSNLSYSNPSTDGQFLDDQERRFTVARAFKLRDVNAYDRWIKALNQAKGSPPKYDLASNNCASWVVKMARLSGISTYNFKLISDDPNSTNINTYTPRNLSVYLYTNQKDTRGYGK